MAEEVITPPVADAAADESFETFFARENAADAARLRGEELPAALQPAPIGEPVADEEPAPPVVEEKKPNGRTLEGRRDKQYSEVEKATAARREAERELEAINAKLAQAREEWQRQQPPQQPQPPQAPQAEIDPEPRIEWFAKFADGSENPDPYTSWMRATQKWEARQAAVQTAVALQQRMEQRAAAQQEARAWDARVDAAEQTQPGLRETLKNATIPIDRRVLPHIKRHEHGVEIAAYLVAHPDIAQRLVTLHPVDQIGQIGEIVGHLKASAQAASSGSAAPARPISRAKAPIQPLGTTPVAASSESDDDEPIEAFIRRNNALDRKKGRL